MLRRAITLCAVLFAATAATAQAAPPPPGSLVQAAPPQACFSTDSGAGCSAYGTGIFALTLDTIGISPDGASLYVSTANGGGVEFARAANGDLTPLATALDDAGGIVVSPDGKNVYFGERTNSDTSGGIFEFARGGGGSATFQSCLTDPRPPLFGICPTAEGLVDIQGLAVSPDGHNLYAAAAGAAGNGALTTLTRGPDGKVTVLDCRARTSPATGPCSAGDTPGLGGARAVVVSPDGQTLYTAAGGDRAVVGFSRAVSGPKAGKPGEPINCLSHAPIDGAFCQPTDGILDPTGLAISADGADVYVADKLEGILALRRNTLTGVLTPNGCFGDDPTCTRDAIAEKGYQRVAISPDGHTVYAVGGDGADGWIKVYSRDVSTGKLAAIDCLTLLGQDGCRPAAGIKNIRDVVVSPDGKNVYTASGRGGSGDGAVSVFAVVPQPTPDPVEPPAPGAPQGPAGPVEAPPAPAAPSAPAPDAAPTSKIASPAGRAVKAKALKKISGTASDDHGIARVEVAVVKVESKKCRPLVASGKLASKKRACTPGGFLRASGTTRWSLGLRRKLPAGKYLVFSRAVDTAGHVEAKFGAANRRTITVK